MSSLTLRQSPLRCILVGNYGADNIGDEVLKEYFLASFPDVRWTVTGIDVPRLPFGIRSFFRCWPKTLLTYACSDCVVFGGGSLFTDSESVFACVLWWWHGFVAWMLGKPVLLAFQGVGPFRTTFGERCARFVFQRATFISVRDEASMKRVQEWKTVCAPVLTADPALLLFSRFGSVRKLRGRLTIIPRTHLPSTFRALVEKALAEKPCEVQIVLMQPKDERKIAADLSRLLGAVPHRLFAPSTTEALLTCIGSSTQVVSARYHGALAALALGVPVTVCPQVSGDKLDMLSARGSLDSMLALARSGEQQLRHAFGLLRGSVQP